MDEHIFDDARKTLMMHFAESSGLEMPPQIMWKNRALRERKRKEQSLLKDKDDFETGKIEIEVIKDVSVPPIGETIYGEGAVAEMEVDEREEM